MLDVDDCLVQTRRFRHHLSSYPFDTTTRSSRIGVSSGLTSPVTLAPHQRLAIMVDATNDFAHLFVWDVVQDNREVARIDELCADLP